MLGRMPRRGYTLAEIVVIVIVLGVLAAIVVPQFTRAGVEGKEEQVAQQLHTIRAAIELYQAQHQNRLPDLSSNWLALTQPSDAAGGKTGSPLFGPYLPKPPINPLTGASRISDAGEVGVSWLWDESNGSVTPMDRDGMPVSEPAAQTP